jgi:hypothetical protein
MAGAAWLGAVVLLLLHGVTCGANSFSQVVLLDTRHGNYLHNGLQPVHLSGMQLQSVVSALTGLEPLEPVIQPDLSALVKPSLLRKPKVLLSVNALGLTAGGQMPTLGLGSLLVVLRLCGLATPP